MEKYNRKAVFDYLAEYDVLSKKHSFIEITEWNNGEGFDVDIYNGGSVSFGITWGEFDAMKKLVKKL